MFSWNLTFQNFKFLILYQLVFSVKSKHLKHFLMYFHCVAIVFVNYKVMKYFVLISQIRLVLRILDHSKVYRQILTLHFKTFKIQLITYLFKLKIKTNNLRFIIVYWEDHYCIIKLFHNQWIQHKHSILHFRQHFVVKL